MSVTIDVSFTKQFEREVHLAYQRMGSKLRGMFRTINEVRGATATFQKVGKGTAGQKSRHGLVPVMNLDHTTAEVTLVDRYAADWIDKLDELKINHDERMVVAESAARALGRATDQDIITAALAATNTTAITMTSAATVRNSLLTASKALAERDVPDDNLWGVIPPSVYAALMTMEEFANSQWVGEDMPYRRSMGTVHDWLGVKWVKHTGLNLATNTRTGFIADHNAIGHAIAADVAMDLTWHGDRAAHFYSGSMSMGAVLIDNDGVQELTIDESTALPVT